MVLLVAASMSVACVSAKNTASGVGHLGRSAYRGTSEATRDPSITFAVKSKLIDDELVRARDINVDTVDGIVILRGKQPSYAARARAEKHAWQTEGVREVINEIVVNK